MNNSIRWELPRYTRGFGLDIGCGANKALPHFVGVDDNSDPKRGKPDLRMSIDKLKFADKSLDFIYSAHPHLALVEWSRVIKDGGHLILYTKLDYEQVVSMMDAVPRDWDLIKFEKIDDFFFVFRCE